METLNSHYKSTDDAVIQYDTNKFQFNNILEGLINNVMNSTSKFIISEPINNLATNNGIIGYLARRSTKVGKGDEIFRYNYENLHHALKKSCEGKFVISEI